MRDIVNMWGWTLGYHPHCRPLLIVEMLQKRETTESLDSIY
jgi:hypothetical protein